MTNGREEFTLLEEKLASRILDLHAITLSLTMQPIKGKFIVFYSIFSSNSKLLKSNWALAFQVILHPLLSRPDAFEIKWDLQNQSGRFPD